MISTFDGKPVTNRSTNAMFFFPHVYPILNLHAQLLNFVFPSSERQPALTKSWIQISIFSFAWVFFRFEDGSGRWTIFQQRSHKIHTGSFTGISRTPCFLIKNIAGKCGINNKRTKITKNIVNIVTKNKHKNFCSQLFAVNHGAWDFDLGTSIWILWTPYYTHKKL